MQRNIESRPNLSDDLDHSIFDSVNEETMVRVCKASAQKIHDAHYHPGENIVDVDYKIENDGLRLLK